MFDDYGRPTGEAMLSFVFHENAVAAMKKDRENMHKHTCCCMCPHARFFLTQSLMCV